MPPLAEHNFLAREGRVSASEIAALMPEGHPYMDARDVFDRIVGPRNPMPISDAMKLGTILEPAILRAAADRYGWKVITNAHTYVHQTLPLCATPDARLVGEHALVEVKYSGNPTAWAFLPAHVWWQVQAQMMCTGAQYVEVVVLAGPLKRFTVARNLTAARRIGRAVRDLMDRIADGNPPDHIIRDRNIFNTYSNNIPESILMGDK
jgi:hypothetical protein